MKTHHTKLILLIALISQLLPTAEGFSLPKTLLEQPINWSSDSTKLAIQKLASQWEKDTLDSANSVPLLSLLDQHNKALNLINEYENNESGLRPFVYLHFKLYSLAKISQQNKAMSFDQSFTLAFKQFSARVSDAQLYQMSRHLYYSHKQGVSDLNLLLKGLLKKTKPNQQEILRLVEEYQRFKVYLTIRESLNKGFELELNNRYIIDENVLIKTPTGVTLSAVIVKKKGHKTRLPTALMSTIYTNTLRNKWTAINAANHGYIGVVSDTRGKRLSDEKIEPFEHDGIDTHHVIDWISKQPWSDGQVGMYGGSYSGFVQWAAAKYQHSALKTIVPYVAAIPGQGLPMENNVFITANYAWPFYVTNNKYLDNELYYDNQRWRELSEKWYLSGRSYREIDQVDGLNNPWLQKWLKHPAYDAYWQAMVPYKKQFQNIKIPVLTVTGYYDDGQICLLYTSPSPRD